MSTTINESSYGGFLPLQVGFSLAGVVLVIVYVSVMKILFGTLSLRTAFSNYSKNKVIRKRYYELFASRDNLLYHISWAKSRGELDEARSMMVQLEKVDLVRYLYWNFSNWFVVIIIVAF
jgi:hypothetical protein